ncbi:MAG: DUF3306 domain-containing protein [Burkholderiales bacterium]|nr:DUF3306 domain-containing protein [Burkholderiales bacterium]
MSEDEGFLQRWSRRKRAAGVPETGPQSPGEPERRDEVAAKPEPARPAPEPEFDLSSLPSLEEIGPGTKVDVFLRKGVPLEVSRAALRRAWVSDPAIRDFIGLSENSWDFNATEGVPGFGRLEMTDDLRRMVEEMFTPRDPETPEIPGGPEVPSRETAGLPAQGSSALPTPAVVDSASRDFASKENEVTEVPSNPVESNAGERQKSQQSIEDKSASESVSTYESITKLPRRGHGGALPR